LLGVDETMAANRRVSMVHDVSGKTTEGRRGVSDKAIKGHIAIAIEHVQTQLIFIFTIFTIYHHSKVHCAARTYS
jgi:hypothetical protein